MTLPIQKIHSPIWIKNNFLFFKKIMMKKISKCLHAFWKKGIGKFTLYKHFLNYVFDEKNYDLKIKQFR